MLFDGKNLLLASDRGFWFSARLVIEGEKIARIEQGYIAPMLDHQGRILAKSSHDAEALARLESDQIVVAFEGRHRVDRYDLLAKGFAAKAKPYIRLPDFSDLPANQGIEAMAQINDRLVLLSEGGLDQKGNLRGFWQERMGLFLFFWPVMGNFRPPIWLYILMGVW